MGKNRESGSRVALGKGEGKGIITNYDQAKLNLGGAGTLPGASETSAVARACLLSSH